MYKGIDNMNSKVLEILNSMRTNKKIDLKQVKEAERILNVDFPPDYEQFLQGFNGAEGKVGKYSYLELWDLTKVIDMNKEISVKRYTPNFLYIGSDGAETTFAIDHSSLVSTSVVQMPYDSIEPKDAKVCASTFEEFILNRF